MAHRKMWCTAVASFLMLSGCVTSSMPDMPRSEDASDEAAILGLDSHDARASTDLLNYQSDESPGIRGENLVADAVRDAGRRLGSTAGYRAQAEALYQAIEPYDEYLSKIFDFQELMLPSGIVPPVLAETEDKVSYRQAENGRPSKEIRARVLSTVKDAKFANPKAPGWRHYLRLRMPPLEKPLPQLQPEINKNRGAWKEGVERGYERGIERASQAFEIAINELSRDYVGMQLFRILWVSGQAEPPKIVEQAENVVGGGRGSREMSTGVRRIIISEPVYFVNDSAEWAAIISTAFDEADAQAAGLRSVVQKTDNTQNVPSLSMEPNLNAR